jgi:hypothetical protein
MTRTAAFLSAFLALVFAAAAQAELYKWTDKDGKIRYGDNPPAGVKKTLIKAPPPGEAPPPAKAPSKMPLTAEEQEAQDQRLLEERAKRDKARQEGDKSEGKVTAKPRG